MKAEIIGSRGRVTDLSEQWGMLGHLSFVEGEIISRDLINFNMELAIKEVTGGVDQEWVVTPIYGLGISSPYLWSQQFTPAFPTCRGVGLPIYREGTPTQSLFIEIRELVGEFPIGTLLGQIEILPSDPLVPLVMGVWTDWYFASPITLEIGTKYGLLLRSNEPTSIWKWSIDSISPAGYPGGKFVFSTNGGTSWIVYDGYDLPFKTYVEDYNCIEVGIENLDHQSVMEIESDGLLGAGNNVYIDQSCISISGGLTNSPRYSEWYAQQVVVGVTGIFVGIKLNTFRAYGETTSYPLLIDIYATSGGLPTGPSLSHVELVVNDFRNGYTPNPLIPEHPFGGDFYYATFYAMPPVLLNQGQMYVITFGSYEPNHIGSLCYADFFDYPPGMELRSFDQGANWSALYPEYDFQFAMYFGVLQIERSEEFQMGLVNQSKFELELEDAIEFELELINEEEP